MSERLSPHFLAAEFACNHCGKTAPKGVPDSLLRYLELLRAEYDSPVIINSGYRCPTHNRNVGGATHSRHLEGDAADVVVRGVDPTNVYAFLNEEVGDAGGVGRYNSFTHVDVRGYRARW